MRFTIFEAGDWRLFFYGRWRGLRHALPTLTAVDVVGDDPPHRVVNRWYQAAWLGYTLNLDVPSDRNRRGFVLDFSGVIQTVLRLLS